MSGANASINPPLTGNLVGIKELFTAGVMTVNHTERSKALIIALQFL